MPPSYVFTPHGNPDSHEGRDYGYSRNFSECSRPAFRLGYGRVLARPLERPHFDGLNI